MMFRSRIVSCCLLLILFCQYVEVDQPHSSNSLLPADDTSISEDSKSHIHLNRRKRNANQQTARNIDIEVSIPENGMSIDILQQLLDNITYPIKMYFGNGTINITDITPTTVCQLVNNEIQCTCIGEFTWNATSCSTHQPCSENTAANQICNCIRGYPREGIFCDVMPIMTTPTQSTTPTTVNRTVTPIIISTTTAQPTTTTTSTSQTTTQPNKESTKLALKVINLNFTDELKNSSSILYQNLSTEFDKSLNEAYTTVLPDASVEVLGFSEGSLVVLHNVFSSSPLTDDEIDKTHDKLKEILSEKYETEFLPSNEIPCNDEIFGITSFNDTSEIPCKGMAGVKKKKCELNGQYGDELDFCVLPAISNLLELTNSSTEVAKNFSNLLQELSTASENEAITTPGNVQAVVTILTTFSEVNVTVNETDLANFLQTVSSVISNESISTWKVLSNTTSERNSSSQLLQSVEKFTSRLNLTNDTLEIEQDNLQLSATKIVALKNASSINVTFEKFTIEGYNNLSANIFISHEELNNKENNVVVTIAYPTWIDILPSNGNFLINGLVVTITLRNKRSIKINMTFSPRNRSLDFDSAMCVFWDFSKGAWNDTGCTPVPQKENIVCNCVHLTSFSILMSSINHKSLILDYITQIGVAVSLASLLITIIIEAIVWKQVTKNKTSHTRHVAILNIAISLLIADVWFIVASSVKPEKGACVAATFFIHFFYLSLFFWMLTLGLLLVYHLVFLFHDLSKSVLMGISFSIGYLCPIIISVITVGVTYPRKHYIRKDACWLRWREEYPILAFIIPALTIITSNIIVLLMVIFKLLRPTIGDRPRGQSEEKETFKQIVRSIVVLTPILGLTWGFGIPTFQEQSPIAFHFIFTILNAFQGFFILVFGTCLDKKVREALLKKFSLSGLSSRTRTVQSTSTGKFASKRGVAYPGRRKSYNITGQLHTDSKDKSLSYSTLN